MAFMRSIVRQCMYNGCSKTATHEVCNKVNSVMGYYCLKHAAKRVAEVKKDEKDGF